MRAADTFALFWSSFKVEDLYNARRLIEHSLSIDPNYARAHALLAYTYGVAYIQPLDGDYYNTAALDRNYQSACKALQLDSNLPLAHAQIGAALLFKQQHAASVE